MAFLKRPISNEEKRKLEETDAESQEAANQACKQFFENIKWKLKQYASACKKSLLKYDGDPNDADCRWSINPPNPNDFGLDGLDINILNLEAIGLSKNETDFVRSSLNIISHFEALEASKKLSDTADNCNCSKHGCSNFNGSSLCSLDSSIHDDALNCPYYDPGERTCENCNGQNGCPPERLMAFKMGFQCEHWKTRSN
jgi:hypothetical protein